MPHATEDRDRGLSTARAVLAVLSYIAASPAGVSARDVAAKLHKSRSTAYHLLASLEAEGFVDHLGRSGRYRLIVGKAGAPAPASPSPETMADDLERVLADGMHEVFARTGRRTSIGVFADDGVHLLQDVGRQGLPRMGNVERPAIRSTAHALAIGKLRLASLHEDNLERWLRQYGLRSFTPSTICHAPELRRELETVRRRGVATDNCEFHADFGSVAAPVLSSDGHTVAAISISVTRAQYGAERATLEPALLDVTRELNQDPVV